MAEPTNDAAACVDREKLLETVTQTPEQANAPLLVATMSLAFVNAMAIFAFRSHQHNAILAVFPLAIGAAFACHGYRLLRDRRHGVSYVLSSDRLEIKRGGKTKVVKLDQILDVKLWKIESETGPTGSYRLRALNGEVHYLPMTEEMGRLVKRALHIRDTRDTTWFEAPPPTPPEPTYSTAEEGYVPFQLQSRRLEDWKKQREA